MAPVEAKAQQLPQPLWFLTGVTQPWVKEYKLSYNTRPDKVIKYKLTYNTRPNKFIKYKLSYNTWPNKVIKYKLCYMLHVGYMCC